MLERYRTLGAMLALGEFSVSELTKLSGVRESTVRTTIRRLGDLIERTGSMPTGKPGGQPGRWRIRPEAEAKLRRQLKELERLGAGPWIEMGEPDNDLLAAGLYAAEDVLLRRVPAAADATERADLIRLAGMELDAAMSGYPAMATVGDRAVRSHRRVIELLIELERLIDQDRHSLHIQGRTADQQRIVTDIFIAAGGTGDDGLISALKERLWTVTAGATDAVADSPVADREKTVGIRPGLQRAELLEGVRAKLGSLLHFSDELSMPPRPPEAVTARARAGPDEPALMGRLFGTDGVRGIAGRDLTPKLATDLAAAAASVMAPQLPARGRRGTRPRVVIGRDPRASSYSLEAAAVAGLASSGIDVVRLGVCPAPGVAYLSSALDADFSVLLSGGHNPAIINGVKFFTRDGLVLPTEVEDLIERRLIDVLAAAGNPPESEFGHVFDGPGEIERYVEHLLSTLRDERRSPLAGLKVVVDCANGAAFRIAPRSLREAGADVVVIGAQPDGTNINVGYGSTNLRALRAAVLDHHADVGIAYDGDADRCLAVDASGNAVDGDQILAVLALDLARQGRLTGNTVVTTVMSNLGFRAAMHEAGIELVETPVGGQYILDAMQDGGYVLGGEQSGYIVLGEYSPTGDGLLTALHLLAVMARRGEPLAKLAGVMTRYPQVLINVRGADKSQVSSPQLADAISAAEEELGDKGRVLIRPSGTEDVVRVMVEDQDRHQAQRVADELANAVAAL